MGKHFKEYEQYSNPVARLAICVGHAMNIPIEAPNGWEQFFGINITAKTEFLLRLSLFAKLIDEAEEEITSRPELKQDLNLRPIRHTRAALEQGTVALNWMAFRTHLPKAMESFEYVVETITRLEPSKRIPEDKIKELIEQLDLVRKEIYESDLETSFKRLLVDTITDIVAALDHYRFLSEKEIDAVLARAYGNVVYAPSEDVAKSAAMEKYVDVVNVVRNTVATVREAMPLLAGGLEASVKLLEKLR